jgi:IS30 family transposase
MYPGAKLTADDVRRVRALRSTGRTLRSIADEFGVCHTAISRIITGKSWKELI